MYFVFGYCDYYPEGGANDLQVIKSTIKEAKKYVDQRVTDIISLDSYHVMNGKGKVVYVKRREDL